MVRPVGPEIAGPRAERVGRRGAGSEILLALTDPSDGDVLQFGGVPEVHFFFNLSSIGINRRYANLECIGNLTNRVASPDQVQHFQFAIS